jgi:hypothetical protein
MLILEDKTGARGETKVAATRKWNMERIDRRHLEGKRNGRGRVNAVAKHDLKKG